MVLALRSMVTMPDEDRKLVITECFAKAAAQGNELAALELVV